MRVEEYRKLATKAKYVTPPHESYDQLETMYWNLLLDDKSDPPIYGADVCDSITDPVTFHIFFPIANQTSSPLIQDGPSL